MSHSVLPSRDAIVATAQESIAVGSKSFAAASRLFARDTRERAWLLYAWCRACDDLADGQASGHGMTVVADPKERLAYLTQATTAALDGRWVGDPAFDALRFVAVETRLPRRFALDHIAGFALDADGWQPRTEDDLLRYCYHVAGVVGCMMAVVMGVDPADEATLDRACDLGLAFQLANIARDIAEDASVDRCYLPQDWLAEAGIAPGEMMDSANRAALTVLARRLVGLAARFEDSARFGTPKLSFRSAWAVLAATEIYGEIGREVGRRGETAFDDRVTTSATAKLRLIALTLGWAARRKALYRPASRDPSLWTRPR